MFESAEQGHEIDKARWAKEVPKLREELLDAQMKLLDGKKGAVLVLVGGVDGAGKGETVNLLNSWLDPRHVTTYGFGAASDEELERPPFWRFWRVLPPRGKVGIFFGSWYTDPIVARAYKKCGAAELDAALERIRHFERMLADEGIVLLKLWFHLSKDEQRKRLKKLAGDKLTAWRVTDMDWKHFGLYDRFRKISSRALRETSTGYAPWIVVPGGEPRYRGLTVGRAVLEALRTAAKAERRKSGELVPPPSTPPADGKYLVESLDQSKKLDDETYEKRLEKLQGKLSLLVRSPEFAKRSLVVVFEGMDAAGKGGAIRRVTAALDARRYAVVPIAAPTDEERVQPYLWRFWRHLPRHGRVVVFDRSWYGRVLVERVEGFCGEYDWARAYQEINEFEEQMVQHGTVVAKLWLQIDLKEQLARFKEREATGFKRHKITEEDWRNRKKWPAYVQAVSDMVDRTSTEIAPWALVAANDKNHARVEVLRAICDRIEASL